MEEKLKWFEENYTEDAEEIRNILINAEFGKGCSLEKLHESCIEIRLFNPKLESLKKDIDVLVLLAAWGTTGATAGKMLRNYYTIETIIFLG